MKHLPLIPLLLGALLATLSADPIEAPAKPAPAKPVPTKPAPAKPDLSKLLYIRSLAEAKQLPEGTEAVRVQFAYGMGRSGAFVAIMKELAANPKIKHLRLDIPNSSHVKNEHLEVLREFKTLETFDLLDSRDFGGDEILKITAAMPLLKKVDLAFR